MPNKTTLLMPSIDEALHQPIPTAELEASAPNKTILSAPPVDETPN